MSYSSIQSAFDGVLSTIAGFVDVVTENDRFKPTQGQPYARSTLLPSQKGTLSLGQTGKDLQRGIYQVDIVVPADAGISVANDLADKVVTAFPRGAISGTDIYVTTAQRELGRRDGAFYVLSTTVRWLTVE